VFETFSSLRREFALAGCDWFDSALTLLVTTPLRQREKIKPPTISSEAASDDFRFFIPAPFNALSSRSKDVN
jgi:hypothetical protein